MFKKILILFFILVSGTILSGCQEPQFDIAEAEKFFNDNEEMFDFVADESAHVLTDEAPMITIDKDGCSLCSPGIGVIRVITAEDDRFGKLISVLLNSTLEGDITIEKTKQGISISVENGANIYYCEKTIEDGHIVFESDHRKDREGEYKGMYYQLTLTEIKEGVYLSHFESKAPWYAIFMAT